MQRQHYKSDHEYYILIQNPADKIASGQSGTGRLAISPKSITSVKRAVKNIIHL